MCSHYEAPTSGQLAAAFGLQGEQGTLDLWPGYLDRFYAAWRALMEKRRMRALDWRYWQVRSD